MADRPRSPSMGFGLGSPRTPSPTAHLRKQWQIRCSSAVPRSGSSACTGEGVRGLSTNPHSGLCAPVGQTLRCAGQPGRIDRLALLPTVRQPLNLRSAPRRERRALVFRGRQLDGSDQALPGPHHGVGDHDAHADGCGRHARTALAMGYGNRGHELGKAAPHVLLRRATCTQGQVDLSLEFVPRPEYGLNHPSLDVVDGGVAVSGSGQRWCCQHPWP